MLSPKSSFMGHNKEIYFLKKKIHKTIQKKRTTEAFVGHLGYVSPKIQSVNTV